MSNATSTEEMSEIYTNDSIKFFCDRIGLSVVNTEPLNCKMGLSGDRITKAAFQVSRAKSIRKLIHIDFEDNINDEEDGILHKGTNTDTSLVRMEDIRALYDDFRKKLPLTMGLSYMNTQETLRLAFYDLYNESINKLKRLEEQYRQDLIRTRIECKNTFHQAVVHIKTNHDNYYNGSVKFKRRELESIQNTWESDLKAELKQERELSQELELLRVQILKIMLEIYKTGNMTPEESNETLKRKKEYSDILQSYNLQLQQADENINHYKDRNNSLRSEFEQMKKRFSQELNDLSISDEIMEEKSKTKDDLVANEQMNLKKLKLYHLKEIERLRTTQAAELAELTTQQKHTRKIWQKRIKSTRKMQIPEKATKVFHRQERILKYIAENIKKPPSTSDFSDTAFTMGSKLEMLRQKPPNSKSQGSLPAGVFFLSLNRNWHTPIIYDDMQINYSSDQDESRYSDVQTSGRTSTNTSLDLPRSSRATRKSEVSTNFPKFIDPAANLTASLDQPQQVDETKLESIASNKLIESVKKSFEKVLKNTFRVSVDADRNIYLLSKVKDSMQNRRAILEEINSRKAAALRSLTKSNSFRKKTQYFVDNLSNSRHGSRTTITRSSSGSREGIDLDGGGNLSRFGSTTLQSQSNSFTRSQREVARNNSDSKLPIVIELENSQRKNANINMLMKMQNRGKQGYDLANEYTQSRKQSLEQRQKIQIINELRYRPKQSSNLSQNVYLDEREDNNANSEFKMNTYKLRRGRSVSLGNSAQAYSKSPSRLADESYKLLLEETTSLKRRQRRNSEPPLAFQTQNSDHGASFLRNSDLAKPSSDSFNDQRRPSLQADYLITNNQKLMEMASRLIEDDKEKRQKQKDLKFNRRRLTERIGALVSDGQSTFEIVEKDEDSFLELNNCEMNNSASNRNSISRPNARVLDYKVTNDMQSFQDFPSESDYNLATNVIVEGSPRKPSDCKIITRRPTARKFSMKQGDPSESRTSSSKGNDFLKPPEKLERPASRIIKGLRGYGGASGIGNSNLDGKGISDTLNVQSKYVTRQGSRLSPQVVALSFHQSRINSRRNSINPTTNDGGQSSHGSFELIQTENAILPTRLLYKS